MTNLASTIDIVQPPPMVDNFPAKKLIPLTQEMAEEVAEYRFERRIASETEAYRRLLRLALDAERSARPPKK